MDDQRYRNLEKRGGRRRLTDRCLTAPADCLDDWWGRSTAWCWSLGWSRVTWLRFVVGSRAAWCWVVGHRAAWGWVMGHRAAWGWVVGRGAARYWVVRATGCV